MSNITISSPVTMDQKLKRKRSFSTEELREVHKRALTGVPPALSYVPFKPRLGITTIINETSKSELQKVDQQRTSCSSEPMDVKKKLLHRMYMQKKHPDLLVQYNKLQSESKTVCPPTYTPVPEKKSEKLSNLSNISEPTKQTREHQMELYKTALSQIEELQQSLAEESSVDSDDESDLQDHLDGILGPSLQQVSSRVDPETLGFLVCAQETMKYLTQQGVEPNDPMFVNLRNRFVHGLNALGMD